MAPTPKSPARRPAATQARRWLGALPALLLPLAVSAAAQAPVAVVEDVRGQPEGVEFMDYVAAGKLIRLGPKDTLVLGYLQSCWRETITGGTVTVGAQQSSVQGGRVDRVRVACDAGRMQLGAREGKQSAATVYRSFRPPAPAPAPVPVAAEPPMTVYGLSPVIELGALRGTLVIERTDETAPRTEVPVQGAPLLRERYFDLDKAGVTLVPGVPYLLRLGDRRLEFRVAPEAVAGAAPLVGRLLRLD